MFVCTPHCQWDDHAFVREEIMKETRKENITVQSGFTYDFFSFNPSKHRDPLKDIKTQCRGKTVALVTLEKNVLKVSSF